MIPREMMLELKRKDICVQSHLTDFPTWELPLLDTHVKE